MQQRYTEREGMAPLIKLATIEMSGQLYTNLGIALHVLTEQEAGWDLEPAWTFCKKKNTLLILPGIKEYFFSW
jgi:hypothetical protein